MENVTVAPVTMPMHKQKWAKNKQHTKYRCFFVYVGILIKNYGYEMMTKAKIQRNKCSLSPRFDTIKCGIQIECIIWNQIVLNSSGSLMWLFHLFVHRNSSTRLRLEMLFIVGVSYQNFDSCIIEQINEHFFRLIKLHKVQRFITFYLRSVRLFLWKFQIVCAILFLVVVQTNEWLFMRPVQTAPNLHNIIKWLFKQLKIVPPIKNWFG